MIKAKKSLGQNFLIDNNIISKILNVIDIQNKDILEIGPGTGNLTAKILKKKPKRLLVIEKDKFKRGGVYSIFFISLLVLCL